MILTKTIENELTIPYPVYPLAFTDWLFLRVKPAAPVTFGLIE
jgi:hypothetical protein